MALRKGLTVGEGKGYRNYRPMFAYDHKVHQMSGKGQKQAQRLPVMLKVGTPVWSKFYDVKGSIYSKDPFAVKYQYENKTYVRLSNPKYWQKGGKAGNVLVAFTKGKETVYIQLPKKDVKKIANEIGYKAQIVKGGKLPESVNKFFSKVGSGIKKGAVTVGTGVKKAYEWEKEHLPKQIKAVKKEAKEIADRIEASKEESEIKARKEEEKVAPIYTKMVAQQNRVQSLKNDIAEHEEKGTIKKKHYDELEEEEHQLHQIQEKITEMPMEDLSDTEVRHLAIVTKDESLFGSGNRYESELLRRIDRTKEIDKHIQDARRKPIEKGFFE
jgi:hypothetical protein